MTKFPTLDIAPKNQPITAVVFDGSQDWNWVLRLAKWCGGEAFRDESPGQSEKPYYWSIVVDEPYRFRATPGAVIVKYASGEFGTIGLNEFDSSFKYNNALGTFPCYTSPEDGKYHKARSSYSEFADYAMCSTKTHLVPISRDVQFHTSHVSMAAMCLKCFGCTEC